MREILFRGKRLDNGEWIYGYYLYSEKYNKHYIVDERITTTLEGKLVPQESGFIKKEAIPETVVQYTGLTDKNGKKIFEGDIIKAKYEEKNGYIKWNNDNASFQVKGIPSHTLKRANELEVIGNIFDKEGNDEVC
ncbi:YopX family protein [uncultured Thomasclavelia sp.]|uniref:YopX family protein n=1 Tax=uncultured Thomasclavelia sp. TaxID=3025759 RepID=UPI002594AEE8|nr:YopX family protein [uncultured Thomasclavelia sp.]